MGRVVAIAGGDLLSTRKLNVHAITLSNKTTPNVLFIGTASHDAEGYIDAITKEYNQLNCEVKSLCLVSGDQKDIDALLSWADIIYVGGGDTIFMMQIWKQYKLDEKLRASVQVQFAGLIAGIVIADHFKKEMTGIIVGRMECYIFFIWPIVHTTMKKEGILLIKC